MNLRDALAAYLEHEGISLLSLCSGSIYNEGDYVAVNRWLRRRRDRRTGRVYGLPLRLRLWIASSITYEGRLLSDRELARAALPGKREEGRKEGDRISEKNKKKSRRAVSKGTKLGQARDSAQIRPDKTRQKGTQ
jgi:hypothetical protein